ncbi:hypothetical protein S83_063401, partial [Arachis hypogaea]
MFKKFEFGHRKRFVKLQLSLKLYEVVEKQKSFRRKKIAIIFHLYNENTEDNVAIESSKAADEAAEIVLNLILALPWKSCTNISIKVLSSAGVRSITFHPDGRIGHEDTLK